MALITCKAKPGDRVGAIQSSTSAAVMLFGYGVFVGEIPAPFGPYGSTLEEWKKATGLDDYLNPCIELDDGTRVWGIECWWGPEESIRELIGDRKVFMVKPDDRIEVRRQQKQREAKS